MSITKLYSSPNQGIYYDKMLSLCFETEVNVVPSKYLHFLKIRSKLSPATRTPESQEDTHLLT